MSRKDYKLIANALHLVRPCPGDTAMFQWRTDREAILLALSRDNPRFDATRFIKACDAD